MAPKDHRRASAVTFKLTHVSPEDNAGLLTTNPSSQFGRQLLWGGGSPSV